jgi:serine/threonine protein kinase
LVWWTGMGVLGSVSPESIGAILAAEYRVLREHPTELLPTVEAAGTDHGLPYYVMEYLAGPTLREVLAGSAAADRTDLVAPFARLAAALRSAHGGSTAFIHGDLKPENIIVTADRWRIIDPALRGDVGSVSRVATRAYNPTIDFSAQSDLRALAIILFEIVAGWQPFMNLSPRWIQSVWPGDPFRAVWACLETAQCTRSAREPFFEQLLAWMREPPSYAALAAFVHAPPQRSDLTRLASAGDS